MRRVMRGLGWSIVVAAMAAALVAVGRATFGRLGSTPDGPTPYRGSFDNWPAVPQAPDRVVPNGSHVPTGS